MPSIHDYMGKEDMADLWADYQRQLAAEMQTEKPVPMPDFSCPDCDDPPRCGNAMRCMNPPPSEDCSK